VRTVIVGAGPAGLFTAIALARRGRNAVVVDRDGGPDPHTPYGWDRKGVMQFHHPHTFRGQVVDALQIEMPDVLRRLIANGASVVTAPGTARPAALLCRRILFERILRETAAAEPGVTLVSGHVDQILRERGSAVGVRIAGRTLAAELLIDASGRASRVTNAVRPPAMGHPCGAAYVSRHCQLRADAGAGPVNSPIGLSLSFDGYSAVVFLHDNRTFSVVVIYDGAERALRELRHAAVLEAALNSIPALAEWIDPDRSYPITHVLPGGRLYNTYRGQFDDSGRPALPGMVSIGDAVCTTTPLAGRGVALALMQSRALIWLLDEHGRDYHTCTAAFDQWCLNNIKPWFDDHTYVDEERLQRWAGYDVDLTRPLPSDLIVDAAEANPKLRPLVASYLSMDALPASLAPAEVRARQVYARGWRRPLPLGPSVDELAELCVGEHLVTPLASTA
jgi:2-polyprenyl-6-methoxyphenol hydroxylase-like FAD-dependent oxidoreductase